MATLNMHHKSITVMCLKTKIHIMYNSNLNRCCDIFQVLHKYSSVSSAVRKQSYFHNSAEYASLYLGKIWLCQISIVTRKLYKGRCNLDKIEFSSTNPKQYDFTQKVFLKHGKTCFNAHISVPSYEHGSVKQSKF